MKGNGVLDLIHNITNMGMNLSRISKTLITLVALLNIIAMLVFEYGLPSPAVQAKETSTAVQGEEKEIGTIEAVEKEKAEKEAEAVETALAREEEQGQEESEDAEDPEEDVEEERDPDAPILELTDDHIYLSVGDRFNYMSYIKTMKDVDGSDLSRYIHLDRDVDTSVPGEIELTYRITSVITGKSASKALLITIQ